MKARLSHNARMERKAQILAAASVPGCVIANLAKSHSISKAIIYRWLREQKNSAKHHVHVIDSAPRFLEVELQPPLESECSAQISALQKASLIFDDFSLVIEGKISSARLISILKILEG